MNHKSIATALAAILIAMSFIGTARATWTLDVGVYEDEGCTIELTHINWGVIYPNSWNSHVMYFKNLGNTLAEIEFINVYNWNPEYVWVYLGLYTNMNSSNGAGILNIDSPSIPSKTSVLALNEVKAVTLYMYVSPEIQEVDFHFDIDLHYKLAGDVDHDDDCDFDDYVALAGDYGKSTPTVRWAEDITYDGNIGYWDEYLVSNMTGPTYLSEPPYVAEDVDKNHYVNYLDVGAVGLKYGQEYSVGYYHADFDRSGTVGYSDMVILAAMYGVRL